MYCKGDFDRQGSSWVAWQSRVVDFEERVERDSGRREWVMLVKGRDGSLHAFVDEDVEVCFGREGWMD